MSRQALCRACMRLPWLYLYFSFPTLFLAFQSFPCSCSLFFVRYVSVIFLVFPPRSDFVLVSELWTRFDSLYIFFGLECLLVLCLNCVSEFVFLFFFIAEGVVHPAFYMHCMPLLLQYFVFVYFLSQHDTRLVCDRGLEKLGLFS